MTKPAAKVEPTEEQLRLAFRQMRRPNWPDTFEAAMQSHTLAVCIRGRARNLARAPVCGPTSAPAPAPPPRPTPAPALPRRAPSFDARRAAANDFDHDDDDNPQHGLF